MTPFSKTAVAAAVTTALMSHSAWAQENPDTATSLERLLS